MLITLKNLVELKILTDGNILVYERLNESLLRVPQWFNFISVSFIFLDSFHQRNEKGKCSFQMAFRNWNWIVDGNYSWIEELGCVTCSNFKMSFHMEIHPWIVINKAVFHP